MHLIPVFDPSICRKEVETLLLLLRHIFKATVYFSIAVLSLVLPSQGNLKGTRLLKIKRNSNYCFLAKCNYKQTEKVKDKSQLLKGPSRLYRFFCLPFTSSALPSSVKSDTLLIYFFYCCGQDVCKWIFISLGRISLLYPVVISRFMYNTSAAHLGKQTSLKPTGDATGFLIAG